MNPVIRIVNATTFREINIVDNSDDTMDVVPNRVIPHFGEILFLNGRAWTVRDVVHRFVPGQMPDEPPTQIISIFVTWKDLTPKKRQYLMGELADTPEEDD